VGSRCTPPRVVSKQVPNGESTNRSPGPSGSPTSDGWGADDGGEVWFGSPVPRRVAPTFDTALWRTTRGGGGNRAKMVVQLEGRLSGDAAVLS